MMFVPTSNMTVLKESESTDAFGDSIDTYSAVETVGAHLYETSSLSYIPSEGRVTTVKIKKVLLPPSLTIDKGYRLKDEDGTIYMVEDLTVFKNIVGITHKEATLRLVS